MTARYTPTAAEREEFIRAAGFRFGWENLESTARLMVDHALQARQVQGEETTAPAQAEQNR